MDLSDLANKNGRANARANVRARQPETARNQSAVFASASKSFAAIMRSMASERQRLKEERVELLLRERKAQREAEEVRRELARRLFELQADERRRISRELHDRVAHSMGIVHQSLELYEALKETGTPQAEARLQLAREMAKSALDSTRNLSMALRCSEAAHDLESALSDLLRTNIPPDVEHDLSVEGEEQRVPALVREQLFVILREAVRNAVAHSGGARISVELNIQPERVLGLVRDDGGGFDKDALPPDTTNGLKSMEERARLIEGAFRVYPAPDGGTLAEVSVPLRV